MKWAFIFFLFTFQFEVNATEQNSLEKAAQYFSDNSFQEAAQIYEGLLKSKGASADLYYNLANCYHRMGALAQARMYYERALVLEPNDPLVANNLEMLLLQLEVGQEVLFTSLAHKILFEISSIFTAERWAFLFTFSSWLVLALAIVWIFAQKRNLKKLGFYLSIVFLVFSLCSFFLGRKRFQFENDTHFYITLNNKGAKIHLAPDILSPIIEEIPQGRKSLVIDSIDTWYKVWIEKDIQGWVEKTDGEKI